MSIDPLHLEFLSLTIPLRELVQGLPGYPVPQELAFILRRILLSPEGDRYQPQVAARLEALFAAAETRPSRVARAWHAIRDVKEMAVRIKRRHGFGFDADLLAQLPCETHDDVETLLLELYAPSAITAVELAHRLLTPRHSDNITDTVHLEKIANAYLTTRAIADTGATNLAYNPDALWFQSPYTAQASLELVDAWATL